MNPLQTFGRNVVEGAKMVTPSNTVKGIGRLGSDLFKTTFGKKKANVAAKMATPPTGTTTPETEYNQGFGAYNKVLKDAIKY